MCFRFFLFFYLFTVITAGLFSDGILQYMSILKTFIFYFRWVMTPENMIWALGGHSTLRHLRLISILNTIVWYFFALFASKYNSFSTCVLNNRILITTRVSFESPLENSCCLFRNLGIICSKSIFSWSSKQSQKHKTMILTSFR